MATGEFTQLGTIRTFQVDLSVSSGGIGQDTVVALGSSAIGNDIIVCGANDIPIGVTCSDSFPPAFADTTGARQVEVLLFAPTKVVRASTDIARGAFVGPAALGRVSARTPDQSAPATVVPIIGIAFDASTAGTQTNVQDIEVMITGGFLPV